MTQTATLSILPIHPPPVPSSMPPATLNQVRAMVAHGSTTPPPQHTRPVGMAQDVGQLPELLAGLSVRYRATHFLLPQPIHPDQLKDLITALDNRPTGARLSLGCLIDGPVNSDDLAMDKNHGIVQIQWRITGLLPDLRFFKTFSNADIWNHLILDGVAAAPPSCQAIARQPNIIHSWEVMRGADGGCDPDLAYGQVKPLPGRPLWQTVNDPVSRFLLVDRLTKDHVHRMRVDDDGEGLYTVGASLEYRFLPPDRLPDGHLEEICEMVAAGGTVATTHVRYNLERAHLIGYVQEKGVIVGNSSLKNPRPEYIDTVRHQSGLDLTGFVERGYTSVRPEYRGLGIGTTLLEGLTQRAGDRKIFSVIAEDNAATKVIAVRNHTRQVATYYSEKAGKPVGIWMPAWMIDSSVRRGPT